MHILVIDGQGGQLGAQLIKAVLAQFTDISIEAVGTNAMATAAMIKAGAKHAATGENPVMVACRKADSLLGEVTPKMAVAIGQADATRILIPMNRCENLIAGIPDLTMTKLVEDTVTKLGRLINSD